MSGDGNRDRGKREGRFFFLNFEGNSRDCLDFGSGAKNAGEAPGSGETTTAGVGRGWVTIDNRQVSNFR